MSVERWGGVGGIVGMYLRVAAGLPDLDAELAEVLARGERLSAQWRGEDWPRLTRLQEIELWILLYSGTPDRPVLAAVQSGMDAKLRPNLTPGRAVALHLCEPTSPSIPGATRAQTVLARMIKMVVVRQTADPPGLEAFRARWLRPHASAPERPWKGYEFGEPPPGWRTRAATLRRSRDGGAPPAIAAFLRDLAALYRVRLDRYLPDALAALVRTPFLGLPQRGLTDPFALAAELLGGPLSSSEAAELALALIGPDSTPPPNLVRDLAELLGRYPASLQCPLHAALALSTRPPDGEKQDEWSPPWPPADGALAKLWVTALTVFNRATADMGMIAKGLLTRESADLFADWCKRMSARGQCTCGHHAFKVLRCRARRDKTGTRCRTLCCAHSYLAYLDPAGRTDALEPIGVHVIRELTAYASGRLGSDIPKGLYARGATALGPALEWDIPGGRATFSVLLDSVGFAVCPHGEPFEGRRCRNCESPSERVDGSWEVRRNWLFAERIRGWFQYDLEPLYPCPGPNCRRFFQAHQAVTPCPGCGGDRRVIVPAEMVWIRFDVGEHLLGDDDPEDDG